MEDAFSKPRRTASQVALGMGVALQASASVPGGSSIATLGAASTSQPPASYKTTATTPDGGMYFPSNRGLFPLTPFNIQTDDSSKPAPKSTPKRIQSKKLAQILGAEVAPDDEKPWYLKPSYTEKELIYTPDGEVRGGTVTALVEKATSNFPPGGCYASLLVSLMYAIANLITSSDTVFIEAFLMTFKTFTNAAELIDLLATRFEKPPPPELTDLAEAADWRKNWQEPVRKAYVTDPSDILRCDAEEVS
jgi:son of sevenless-like protein